MSTWRPCSGEVCRAYLQELWEHGASKPGVPRTTGPRYGGRGPHRIRHGQRVGCGDLLRCAQSRRRRREDVGHAGIQTGDRSSERGELRAHRHVGWGTGELQGPGCIMDRDAYDLIQDRIKNSLGRQAPSVWIGVACAALGIAVSAAFVVLAFPKRLGSIPPGAKGNIETIGVAALVIFVLVLIFHRTGSTISSVRLKRSVRKWT